MRDLCVCGTSQLMRISVQMVHCHVTECLCQLTWGKVD